MHHRISGGAETSEGNAEDIYKQMRLPNFRIVFAKIKDNEAAASAHILKQQSGQRILRTQLLSTTAVAMPEETRTEQRGDSRGDFATTQIDSQAEAQQVQ